MERRHDVSEVVRIPQKKKGKVLKKVIISIASILLSLVFFAVVGVLLYMNSIGINFIETENVNENDDNSVLLEDFEEDNDAEEDYNIITAVRDNSDIKGSLYNWYTNGGSHMKSKNVLNILIVGVDASGEDNMTGNSDVMMLASVNKKEGKITLCSFLRDSYTYFEDSDGNGYYSKLTSAYANGGADCLMNAIENNYKIKIDYFVAVDFEAFETIIDTIGGINIDITEEEAITIKNTIDTTGSDKYQVPFGENVLLNGEQALVFARLRKIYNTGDIQRTQNQRKVINAIIKKARTLSLSDLNNVVQALGEYVYTDCPSTKILSLGTNAILGKWYNFQVYSMEAPPESARDDYKGPPWMWIVDYPYSAQYVQKQIFGKSNIVIQ